MTMRGLSVVLAATLLTLPFAARAEDFVVIESSAPALAVGTQIAGNAPVNLPEKTRLVLLSASGRTLVLTGPFQGVAKSEGAGGDSRLLTAVASLVRSNAQESGSVGAVRAADIGWRLETAKDVSDVLAVDASNGGDVCLEGGRQALIVHNPHGPAGRTTIQAADSNAAAAIDWTPGAARAPWPSKLPLADGAQYLIEQQGQSSVAIATLHLLPAAPGASDLQLLVRLTEAGCTDQGRLLVSMIAKQAAR
jgi:hypothetical protein